MAYLVALVPIALMLLAIMVFVAVGARPDDENAPSALLPSLGGILLLSASSALWFWLGLQVAVAPAVGGVA